MKFRQYGETFLTITEIIRTICIIYRERHLFENVQKRIDKL